MIELRPTEPGDLPVLYEHQADPVAAARAAFPSRDRAAFDAHWATIMANPANLLRTILLDGEVVGTVMSWTHDDRRNVGYWVGREHWGRGIATAALRAFLDVDTHRPLHADSVVSNAASIAVLKRCGFTEAGRDGEQVVLVKAD